MLKEISPSITEVGVILHPENASNIANINALEAAAGSVAVELSILHLRERVDIERAIEGFAARSNVGLVVLSNANYHAAPRIDLLHLRFVIAFLRPTLTATSQSMVALCRMERGVDHSSGVADLRAKLVLACCVRGLVR